MARTPTDPTKPQVWITKGLDDLDFEFYFPQGPKGDPGGLNLGIPLDNSADTGTGKYNLNDVVVSGIYRMTATNDGLLSRNYPRNYDTGILHVMERVPGQTIIQAWYSVTQNGRVRYERTYQSGVWTAWRLFTTARVDQTAGRAMYLWDDVNNREQIVYGDTGVRDIKTDIKNGWAVALMSLRRVNNVVTMGFYTMNPAAKTDPTAYSLPNGFRPAGYGGNLGFPVKTAASPFTDHVVVTGSGDVQPPQTTISGSGIISLITFTTSDVWPTTLPGVALGSIPNS